MITLSQSFHNSKFSAVDQNTLRSDSKRTNAAFLCYSRPGVSCAEEIEIIIRFIEAFNKGGRGGACDIVDCAIMQYDRLKEKAIYAEEII
jgi:hypothetical protein